MRALKPAARVDNYRGFYFASLSPDGPDLETFLGGATLTFDQLVDRAPDGDVEVVGDCFRMIQKSNWKIFLENQLDVSHPSATHESTGVSAGQVEREIEKRDGQKPPLAYSFISAFKTPIEEWGKFDTVGHPHGHCFLAGYMGLRPQDPDTVEYETLLPNRPMARRRARRSCRPTCTMCWSIPACRSSRRSSSCARSGRSASTGR